MTEAEWLAATDPTPMLESLRGKASDRKLRLIACACCRQMWDRITEPGLRYAVEVSERFADGEATASELSAAAKRAKRAVVKLRGAEEEQHRRHEEAVARAMATGLGEVPPFPDGSIVVAAEAAEGTALKTTALLQYSVRSAHTVARWDCETVPPDQAGLIRDCFGPQPFRPITGCPSWRTSTVLALAEGIYADRAFDRLPILADALMDAGCENADILNHCRSDGPHVRGCWLVDLLLGKS